MGTFARAYEHRGWIGVAEVGHREAVDQAQAPGPRDGRERGAQGGEVGLVQPVAVDAAHAARDDHDLDGGAHDHRVELVARLGIVLLGVVENGQRAPLRPLEGGWPETIAQMMTNQLPEGQWIRFAMMGEQPGKAYGLAGGLILQPSAFDHPDASGEFYWGGVAGTQWWISPKKNMAGVMMAQRQMAFVHPFSFEFKRLAYETVKQNAEVVA